MVFLIVFVANVVAVFEVVVVVGVKMLDLLKGHKVQNGSSKKLSEKATNPFEKYTFFGPQKYPFHCLSFARTNLLFLSLLLLLLLCMRRKIELYEVPMQLLLTPVVNVNL